MQQKTFSPLLLAGILLRPLPIAPLDRLVKKLAMRLNNKYPRIIERLRPLSGTCFLINATDLPYLMELVICEDDFNIRLCTKEENEPDVRVSGAFTSLLDMLNSKVDGDSLFFSRELRVEGDTEALLTLRNALDSEDIDLKEELLSAFGKLRTPAAFALSQSEKLFHRMNKDMKIISEAIISPLAARQDSLAAENESIRTKITSLDAKVTKQQKQIERLAKK